MAETDWSDRLRNVVTVGVQLVTLLVVLEQLHINVVQRLAELRAKLVRQWRQWQFEQYYAVIWPVIRPSHNEPC